MAFTLECVCSGGSLGCQLSSLTFHIEQTYVSWDGYNALADVTIDGTSGGGASTIHHVTDTSMSATYDFDLPLDTDWDSLTISLAGDSSAYQWPPNRGCSLGIKYYILEDFLCYDEHGNPYHVLQHAFDDTNTVTAAQCFTGGVYMSMLRLGDGGGSFVLFGSRPGAACNGCSGSSTGFSSNPFTRQAIDGTNGQGVTCLCPVDGTPPYRFFVSGGSLASGMSLDEATGCLTGTPDGLVPASSVVSFQAYDSTGAIASTSCKVVSAPCGGCGPGGNFGNNFY
jgi:hypothetical protein